MRARIAAGIAALFPGYFALVMATGIVSIAGFLLDLRAVAYALLAVNVTAYAVLWFLLVGRLLFFRHRCGPISTVMPVGRVFSQWLRAVASWACS